MQYFAIFCVQYFLKKMKVSPFYVELLAQMKVQRVFSQAKIKNHGKQFLNFC